MTSSAQVASTPTFLHTQGLLWRWGNVRVKAGAEGFAPEYEDARRIAEANGVALRTVLAETAHEYLKSR